MRERNNLIALVVIAVVSLVPTCVLYYWFSTISSADVSWADDKVKLGGPIAAFVAIFVVLSAFYNRLMAAPTNERDVAEPYVARWRATFKSETGRTLTSIVDANLTDAGKLLLGGDLKDQAGTDVGEWEAREVFCTPTSLAYRYLFIDKVPSVDGTTLGFCTLRIEAFNKKKQPRRLTGNWDVIGPKHHGGTIELVRTHG
jgi:hypothetical protein